MKKNSNGVYRITDLTEFDFYYSANKEDFSGGAIMTAPNGGKYNICLCAENRETKIYKEIVKKYGDMILVYTGKKEFQNQ